MIRFFLGPFLYVWCSLPHKVRRTITVIPIIAGGVVSFIAWDWLFAAAGAGISVLFFCLPDASESEKKGYNF